MLSIVYMSAALLISIKSEDLDEESRKYNV